MSHFTVYVFTKEDGKDVEELLAGYDESIVYAPYIKYTKQQAIAEVRKEIEDYKNTRYAEYLMNPEAYEAAHDNEAHIKYLKEEFPKKLNWTDEQCYQDKAQWYEEDMIDENGNIYSTYNPNSKWDWYIIGGRWTGGLVTKEGRETNSDYISEIDWNKTDIPFAFITPNGIWHERGEMGWWAIVTNEKEQDGWEAEFKKAIEKLDNDVLVTLVDCHI